MWVSDNCVDLHRILIPERFLHNARVYFWGFFSRCFTLTPTHTGELGPGYRCEASVVGREVNVIQGLQYHTQGNTQFPTRCLFFRDLSGNWTGLKNKSVGQSADPRSVCHLSYPHEFAGEHWSQTSTVRHDTCSYQSSSGEGQQTN